MLALSALAQPDSQFPLVLIPGFVAMWFLVCTLVSWIGGWTALSRTYRTRTPFVGEKWTWLRGQMRWGTHYNNVLTLGVNSQGLYLAILFLYRFRHPPLLVPWSEIRVRRSSGWIFDYVILTLGREAAIPLKISKSLGARLRAAAGGSWPVEET